MFSKICIALPKHGLFRFSEHSRYSTEMLASIAKHTVHGNTAHFNNETVLNAVYVDFDWLKVQAIICHL